jgi:hypothetical protein
MFVMPMVSMHGQTTISPFIGYDFAELKTHRLPDEVRWYTFQIHDKGYSIRSFLTGVEISQYLGNRISVSAGFSVTRKHFNFSDWGFIGWRYATFDSYRYNVLLNYRVFYGFSIGGGYDYNYLSNFKQGWPDRLLTSYEGPFYEDGISFIMSYVYKQFVLRAYYHRGLKDNSVYGANTINFLPINYFSFWLGYRIKLFDPIKIGGKKQTCPTF